MTILSTRPRLADAFASLAACSLNPRRHTASDARAHSAAVAAMARSLGRANGCAPDDVDLLGDLGLVHDIGKTTGTSAPAASLEILEACGVDATSHPRLHALVRWHDTNLPWWMSAQRGESPGDRAWRRLAASVDMTLLRLFMIADRVDAPGGWLRNEPLRWFLAEASHRGHAEIRCHLDSHPSEVSAGGVLVSRDRALLIRVREHGFEVPKGGIEFDEAPEEAAVRELREEANAVGELRVGPGVGELDYTVGRGPAAHTKRVLYFRIDGDPSLGERPRPTLETRWVGADELAAVPLVNEALRDVVAAALTASC